MDYCTFKRLENLENKVNAIDPSGIVKSVDGILPVAGNVKADAVKLNHDGVVPPEYIASGLSEGDVLKAGADLFDEEYLFVEGGIIKSAPIDTSGGGTPLYKYSIRIGSNAGSGFTANIYTPVEVLNIIENNDTPSIANVLMAGGHISPETACSGYGYVRSAAAGAPERLTKSVYSVNTGTISYIDYNLGSTGNVQFASICTCRRIQ